MNKGSGNFAFSQKDEKIADVAYKIHIMDCVYKKSSSGHNFCRKNTEDIYYMRVKECMTKQVISVSGAEPVSVAARLMARHNVGTLPVRDAHGNLDGIITDRDIILRCVAADKSPRAVRVREVMTERVVSASPETDATTAAKLMAREQIRRLPVLEKGYVVGMVTLADLCRRPDYAMEAAEALEGICTGVCRLDGDVEDF